MSGLTFDAGALVGFERAQRGAVSLVARARERGEQVAVPAGVVGEVWRDRRKQANLARLLGSDLCEVVVLNDVDARAAGQLCGLRGPGAVQARGPSRPGGRPGPGAVQARGPSRPGGRSG
ncbi:MAG: hypothetical protein ACLQVK_26780, partial [Acidimicrobiales bacterium]